jgi:hypothetical protein
VKRLEEEVAKDRTLLEARVDLDEDATIVRIVDTVGRDILLISCWLILQLMASYRFELIGASLMDEKDM